MVFGVYTSDLAYGSILCLVFSVPYIFGDVAAGLARYVTQVKWQLVACLVISTSLIAANACATVDNKTTVICLTVIGGFFLGYAEGVSLTLCSVFITDQADIGTAVGAAGTGRFMIATLGVSIYTAVLNSRTAKTIPEKVPAALIQAGLPPSSLTTFIAAISTGSFDKVPGVTPQIIIAGIRAYREALVSAFNTAWLTTMAFACLAILFAVLCPPSDSLLTNSVVATLHQKEDSILVAEDVSVEPKSEENSV
jgi:hypothetical protein